MQTEKKEDQSRQITLLLAAAYLGTTKWRRLRKSLVTTIIQSPVKSVKALRSNYGKHLFLLLLFLKENPGQVSIFLHKSQIFVSDFSVPLDWKRWN